MSKMSGSKLIISPVDGRTSVIAFSTNPEVSTEELQHQADAEASRRRQDLLTDILGKLTSSLNRS